MFRAAATRDMRWYCGGEGFETMTKIQISLPDQLAEEAQRAGLLSSAELERWLREQLSAQHAGELFLAIDRMAAIPEPAIMSPDEIALEIAAMRAERRAKTAQ